MSANLGDFYRKTRTARKIIVVDLGFLGDTVHLVPALWELKRHYPEAQLHVLTTPLGAEVLRLAPCVDRAWGLVMTRGQRTLRQQLQILRALRREQFDVAYNFSGADRTVFMTALCGARHRVAHVARWHFWNSWLIPLWIPRLAPTGPVSERRRQMLGLCGLQLGPARYDLQIPEEEQRWAAQEVPAGAIHLSINASNHLKEWPLEHWIELARQLVKRDGGTRLIATGSSAPREGRRLEAFAAALGPGAQVFQGLSIARLAALLDRCRLHVGADSGVLHLAVALGKPTVSLFRDSAGVKGWLPSGPEHRSILVACPCVEHRRPACLGRPTAACLSAVETGTVLDAVLQQLAARASGNMATR